MKGGGGVNMSDGCVCVCVCVWLRGPLSPIKPDCMSEGCAKHAPPV